MTKVLLCTFVAQWFWIFACLAKMRCLGFYVFKNTGITKEFTLFWFIFSEKYIKKYLLSHWFVKQNVKIRKWSDIIQLSWVPRIPFKVFCNVLLNFFFWYLITLKLNTSDFHFIIEFDILMYIAQLQQLRS